ncbi:Adenine_glyco domain-containing protein [Cephalotus follicularis]|uniref:Adenine_glyco domain-containing protein n=1 Tax=Cephalotus follicularis TaxID=3775 RepID=A0A1Q3AV54_CEPFO|nr:Adenine_glyco domain-containing protein [Cephalotus follicularis]
MYVPKKLRSSAKPVPEPRAILGPTGNRVRVSDRAKPKTEALKKPQRPKITENAVVRNTVSVDTTTCFSDSSSSSSSIGSSVLMVTSRSSAVKRSGLKPAKVAPLAGEVTDFSSENSRPVKRCDWITPHSEPLYTYFHDEEWGVPVQDDTKLFELLVYSQALAELSWPAILNKRDIFRKLLDNFNLTFISQFTEKKLLSLKVNGRLLLSEQKLRAVVENAKQMLKIQLEFSSFSRYVWSFVNHKPVRNGFRFTRQVPVKTPKAELISKDLMQRGFRCVGPTVVYSFMQAAGIVNDHLLTCFRYHECNENDKMDLKPKTEETETLTKALNNTCLSHDGNA